MDYLVCFLVGVLGVTCVYIVSGLVILAGI